MTSAPALTPRFLEGFLCHVAIGCVDLQASEDFYTQVLGAQRFRAYPDRRTYGLANLQLVTHLCGPEAVLWNPGVYPRHFGITFAEAAAFEAMVQRCLQHGADLALPRQIRFEGRCDQHFTFMVRDPSHNLIEFKHYNNPEMAF
jgi:extradiol dioxygenase family protein